MYGVFSTRVPKQTLRNLFVVACLAAACPLPTVFGQKLENGTAAPLPPAAKLEQLEQQAFQEAVALANPSVVRVQTVGGLERIGEMLAPEGPTTGIVVSPDGYILSSAFQFASKPASVLVTLYDGRRFPAKVIATDNLRRLTLLKIDASDLTPLRPTAVDAAQVGAWTIAIGRTYDSDYPSLSIGIVSALNRVWGKAIQTDAKVSPINYGGPLLDIEGRVLGVLVPLSPNKADETAGVEWYDSGIGFAIPYADALDSVERLKGGEDLHAGLLGFGFDPRKGTNGPAVIKHVRYASPAYNAGLKEGDEFVELAGKPTRRVSEVRQVLGRLYAGDTLDFAVRRGDETIRMSAVLVAELLPFQAGYLGVLPQRPDGAVTADLQSETVETPGVPLRGVLPGSPADVAGLKAGDRILQVADTQTDTLSSLRSAVTLTRPETVVAVLVQRGQQQLTLEATLSNVAADVPAELPTAPIVSVDPQAARDPEVKIGREVAQLPGFDGEYWSYVPDSYNPASRYGLVVWIHPVGDSLEAGILQAWRSICDRRGLILVAPKSPRAEGWIAEDAEFAKAVVEKMIDTYSIDPTRVCLHSHTTGSPFAIHLTMKHRELFQGVVLSQTIVQSRPAENRPEYPLSWLMVCEATGELHKTIEAMVTALQKMGYPASLLEIPEAAPQYPGKDEVEAIGRWVDLLDRI